MLAACFSLTLGGCGDEQDAKAGLGDSCMRTQDCRQDENKLICVDDMCIAHCIQTGCDDGYACTELGICIEEFVETDKRECHAEKQCTQPGKVCSVDFVCVTGECSPFVPCPRGRLCNMVNVCVECMSHLDCFDRHVCSSKGECVECLSDDDCASRDMTCDLNTNSCV